MLTLTQAWHFELFHSTDEIPLPVFVGARNEALVIDENGRYLRGTVTRVSEFEKQHDNRYRVHTATPKSLSAAFNETLRSVFSVRFPMIRAHGT